MQPHVERLVNFVRQPTWISVNFLGEKTPEGKNYKFSDAQKRTWRENSVAHFDVNAFFFAMCLNNPAQPFFEGICKERMESSLKRDPELEKRIMPKFKAGCRRITPGDGYLEALQQPNCVDCWDSIERVTDKGAQTANGTEEFDLIVCATGFDSSWLPQWKLVGRKGTKLEDLWAESPQAFYTSMVIQIPNYALINGPNPPISHGSVIQQMSWTGDFIIRRIRYMNRHDIKTLCVKEEAVKDFNEYSQEFLKRTVWSGEYRTLYKNGRTQGRVTGVYARSMTHFQKGLEEVGGEHFDMNWRSSNRFAVSVMAPLRPTRPGLVI